jgi:hypothetical protein
MYFVNLLLLQGILLVSSGDNMDLWWDKSHSRYLNLVGTAADALPYFTTGITNHLQGVPDPGDAQNAGVVLSADFTFNWDNWASAPAQDGVARGCASLCFSDVTLMPTS